MAKNPYTLLGVKKSASDADIRKAYRGLAKKLHPDVNPGDKKAEDKFKEVTAAYNLLSDKDLRARYDSGQVDSSGQQQNPFGGGFGNAGFGGGNPFGGGARRAGGQDDMAELFSSLFGMNMGGMRGGMQPRPAKGATILYKLTLSLPQAIKGGTHVLDKGLKIKVPSGVKNGQTLRMRGKGQAGQYGGPNGDAKVEIKVKKHKYLSRERDNLHLKLPISLTEALGGAKVKLELPNGTVSLNLPAGTNSGKKFRLKGKGISGGDLVVTPIITLTESELTQKATLLPYLKDNQGAKLRVNMF